MIRLLLCSAVACMLCGCLISNTDRAAARAVRTYTRLQQRKIPEKLTFTEALSRCAQQQHNQLRRDFAGLHRAQELTKLYRKPLQMDDLRQALLDAEKARLRLNHSLKFLPETPIKYDTAGAFDVPAELPDVTKFEKAVLIADSDCRTALTRLAEIRRLHAEAVAAYDAVLHAATPAARIESSYQRLCRCADLADAAGTTLAGLPEITAAANRFDAYKKHQVTSH